MKTSIEKERQPRESSRTVVERAIARSKDVDSKWQQELNQKPSERIAPDPAREVGVQVAFPRKRR